MAYDGTYNATVQELQQVLDALGIEVKGGADGKPGDNTKEAVCALIEQNGLNDIDENAPFETILSNAKNILVQQVQQTLSDCSPADLEAGEGNGDVAKLQKGLNALGIRFDDSALVLDDDYGPCTAGAIDVFEQTYPGTDFFHKGLDTTVKAAKATAVTTETDNTTKTSLKDTFGCAVNGVNIPSPASFKQIRDAICGTVLGQDFENMAELREGIESGIIRLDDANKATALDTIEKWEGAYGAKLDSETAKLHENTKQLEKEIETISKTYGEKQTELSEQTALRASAIDDLQNHKFTVIVNGKQECMSLNEAIAMEEKTDAFWTQSNTETYYENVLEAVQAEYDEAFEKSPKIHNATDKINELEEYLDTSEADRKDIVLEKIEANELKESLLPETLSHGSFDWKNYVEACQPEPKPENVMEVNC